MGVRLSVATRAWHGVSWHCMVTDACGNTTHTFNDSTSEKKVFFPLCRFSFPFDGTTTHIHTCAGFCRTSPLFFYLSLMMSM